MLARPKRLIGVLGTHTEVGKTHVSAQWLAHLRACGMRVAARKPVQSFEANGEPTDAQRLASATGDDELAVCPSHRRHPLALAPPMAADALQRPRVRLDDLAREIIWSEDVDVGLVETVGGPRSPLAHDGDSVDLLRKIRPDKILVIADAGLGAINAIRLTLACVREFDTIVYLNRFDAADTTHRLNREWLAAHDGIEAVTAVTEIPL